LKLRRNQNQIWLFSFADLAFLLLMAFTQASTVGKKPISIGEMTLPKVVDGPSVVLFQKTDRLYQVRVHKPAEEAAGPFQLVIVTEDGEEMEGSRMSAGELQTGLAAIYQNGMVRPVLVPDETSLSKDLLLAMSLIEKIWEGERKVTVEKVKTLDGNYR